MREHDFRLTNFLGAHVSALLSTRPFSEWKVIRSTEEDLPRKEVWYEFEGHSVEVVCDEDERVRAIFLHRGDGETLVDIPFNMTRQRVLTYFGTPSKSGDAVRIPVLGDCGAWDRFGCPPAVIHVQYLLNGDEIDTITLMRSDAAP